MTCHPYGQHSRVEIAFQLIASADDHVAAFDPHQVAGDNVWQLQVADLWQYLSDGLRDGGRVVATHRGIDLKSADPWQLLSDRLRMDDHLVERCELRVDLQVCELAATMILELGGFELAAGLRKLFEARDCFARVGLAQQRTTDLLDAVVAQLECDAAEGSEPSRLSTEPTNIDDSPPAAR